ncbi:MAG: hypothetical protein M1816_007315 [Peltula sp. TS41687]|nr:MAG: hypothetical protein M1816_007315 [Peltula sp. TS41687]
MTIPLGRSRSLRTHTPMEDMSEMHARSKTPSSSRNITLRDSIDLLKHSYYTQRPFSPSIPPASEPRSAGPTIMKKSRSFRRKKASEQPDHQNDPPWRIRGKDGPQSAKASVWMDKRFPGQNGSPCWDDSHRTHPIRPRSGQIGIEEPLRSAVSRASSYPDRELGTKNGRWHLLGSLFTKKAAPSPEPSSPASVQVSPRFEVHIEGGTVKIPSRVATEGSRGLFRSRSRRDPHRHNSKRVNTAPIRTKDISKPIPIVDNNQHHHRGQIFRDCSSIKPLLDVEIPHVKLERYSVMFGNLLENHSTPPSLLARRHKNMDRMKSIDASNDDNNGRCQIKLDLSKVSNTVKAPLVTTGHACLSSQKYDIASQPRIDPNPSTRPPGHHRSLTASTVLSTCKPPNSTAQQQHLVVMVHHQQPKRTSSLQTKAAPPPPSSNASETPSLPASSSSASSSHSPNCKTAPSSPLDRVQFEAAVSKTHHHGQALIKAEISIARQVSISRQQRQQIKHVVPVRSSSRVVDGSTRAHTPRVVQMHRSHSRTSQRGLLESA